MATGYALPPPPPLDVHGVQVADNWKRFERAWRNYALAMELNKKSETIQVATLLTVIGEEAREVFATFTGWENEDDNDKIEPVLQKFADYCQPRKSVPFERYCFNRRVQESGESYEQYRTALRKLSVGCDFQSITPEEILRDRLLFGIRDNKVQERLLREPRLTLTKTDEICRAAESLDAQMKTITDGSNTLVNTVKSQDGQKDKQNQQGKQTVPPSKPDILECWHCGRKHDTHKRELCPAFGKVCNRCHKPNHFAKKCRSTAGRGSVRTVDENTDEVFPMQSATAGLDDSQLVTLKLPSGNFIRFEVDTGAQCNVLPVALYKEAAKDHKLKHITPVRSQITAYGGATLPVTGQVRIDVERGNHHYKLECKLVNSTNIRPLLGRKACLEMEIIAYLDNDKLYQPDVRYAAVFALEPTNAVSQQQFIQRYPKVFKEGVGKIAGNYNIRLNPRVMPVQHAPRRVPVALQQRLKETLNSMVRANIIAPVTEPTQWISSMVVVPKKNGTLRICLDPKELNAAILREHYPLPTIEDVATRLHGAKVFIVLDVRSGFWHITLDEPSSFLTTFHTPFGRYRWKRMPFGICSAPEIFQRRMHELIEGLTGIEVIADDFVVVGRGHSEAEAIHDHDKNLQALLQQCEERGVRLNADKLKLRMHKVPFIGHRATDQGLCVDPAKVQAIKEMPTPKDVAGVQRLLGLTQYLSKFLPHLSDITKPLRKLTQKETAWVWDHA